LDKCSLSGYEKSQPTIENQEKDRYRMKILSRFALILFVSTTLTFAEVQPYDDVVFDKPITLAERNQMLAKRGMSSVSSLNGVPFAPDEQSEGVQIFSLCTSTSTSLAQSRANTMAWLIGLGGIPTVRTTNPAACYSIPVDGLQWFDFLGTVYKSWLGVTPVSQATTNENGLRVVVSCAGKWPVGDYWCRIISNSTNIGSNYFPVGLLSGMTNEIQFNLNFVGLDFGPDGIRQSYYDTTLERWVQLGDDHVYINGEYPSQVPYTWWCRFGATIQKTVASQNEATTVRREFSVNVKSVTAELVKPSVGTNGIGSVTVSQAIVSLSATKFSSTLRITISGGQVGTLYKMLTSTNLTQVSVWQLLSNTQYPSGATVVLPISESKRFFKMVAQ
jgi:hypothetical protein